MVFPEEVGPERARIRGEGEERCCEGLGDDIMWDEEEGGEGLGGRKMDLLGMWRWKA